MFLNLHGAESERLEQAGALGRIAARARRRAVRAGDAETDSGHLLHALLEADDRALVLVAPLPTQSTRLMGYLAQRSIGFGLDWRPGEGATARPHRPVPPGWSRSAATALERAELSALSAMIRGRGNGDPDALDLLAALLVDEESRAVEMLRGAGIGSAEALSRVQAAARESESCHHEE